MFVQLEAVLVGIAAAAMQLTDNRCMQYELLL